MPEAQALRELLPLSVEGVEHRQGGRTLLQGVNLTIPDEGCTAVMGPNGAGKSLLLRVINGLLTPQQGLVRWSGIAAGVEHQRRQSLVFQRPVLLRRSVRANLDFVLSLRSGTTRRQRIERSDALLALTDLSARARTSARRLSGGEQQRLALACALASDPDVLLLDEPTASLDPASTAAIEHIIRDCIERRMLVILVTHDAAQARRLAESVIFLCAGQVTEHTDASVFFSAARSTQARDYLAGRLITESPSTAPVKPHVRY